MSEKFKDAIKHCSTLELERWVRQYEGFVADTKAELARRRTKPVTTPLDSLPEPVVQPRS